MGVVAHLEAVRCTLSIAVLGVWGPKGQSEMDSISLLGDNGCVRVCHLTNVCRVARWEQIKAREERVAIGTVAEEAFLSVTLQNLLEKAGALALVQAGRHDQAVDKVAEAAAEPDDVIQHWRHPFVSEVRVPLVPPFPDETHPPSLHT